MPRRTTHNPDGVFDSLQYGFSQAVSLEGGRRVLLSGQVATDARERTIATTLGAQLEVSLDNVERVLADAGGTLADVALLRLYIVASAADDLADVAEVLRHRSPHESPATSWLLVAGLAREDWLIEVEAEAAVAG